MNLLPTANFMSSGLLWGLLSAVGASFLSLGVNLTQGTYSFAEVALYRGLFIMIILLPFVRKELRRLFTREAVSVWLRSILGAGSMLCFFWNLQNSRITGANALLSLIPVFTIVASAIILKERPRSNALLGFVVVTAAVGAMKFADIGGITTQVFLVGLVAAILGALAFVFLRKAAGSFSPMTIVFTLSLAVVVGSLFIGVDFDRLYDGVSDKLLLFIGIASVLTQLTLTMAHRHEIAPIAAVLLQTTVLWAALLDLLWNDVVPGGFEVSLYLAIVVGIYLIYLPNRKISDE